MCRASEDCYTYPHNVQETTTTSTSWMIISSHTPMYFTPHSVWNNSSSMLHTGHCYSSALSLTTWESSCVQCVVDENLQLIKNGGLASIVESNNDDFVLYNGNRRERWMKKGCRKNRYLKHITTTEFTSASDRESLEELFQTSKHYDHKTTQTWGMLASTLYRVLGAEIQRQTFATGNSILVQMNPRTNEPYLLCRTGSKASPTVCPWQRTLGGYRAFQERRIFF